MSIIYPKLFTQEGAGPSLSFSMNLRRKMASKPRAGDNHLYSQALLILVLILNRGQKLGNNLC